jgi:hypothetical protein
VYLTARRSPVDIEDKGDIVCLSWRRLASKSVRIYLDRCAAKVEATLSTSLEDRPSAPCPLPTIVPEWRCQPRGGHPAQRSQGKTWGGPRTASIPKYMLPNMRGQNHNQTTSTPGSQLDQPRRDMGDNIHRPLKFHWRGN